MLRNFRSAVHPFKVSPYLLPNLCANLLSGKAGMLLGFTGPIFPQDVRFREPHHRRKNDMGRGDCDFVLAGAEPCIITHAETNAIISQVIYPALCNKIFRKPHSG